MQQFTATKKQNHKDMPLEEVLAIYKDFPTSTAEYQIRGKQFVVVRHYVGTKNAQEEIRDIAFKQAYADVGLA